MSNDLDLSGLLALLALLTSGSSDGATTTVPAP